jgi:photosystem II stability/assembly factor-like uncharacterized protein/flagellar hook assembly protein FlgD
MKRSSTFLLSLLAAFLCLTEQSYAKVYASYVRVTQDNSLTAPFDGSFADRSGCAIRFHLNHVADSVVVNIKQGATVIRRLREINLPGGENSIGWNGAQANNTPAPAGTYTLEVIAYHRGYSSYTVYHLSNPAIFTRGLGQVTNPALRWFGFLYSASGGGYATGAVRHASSGRQWGNAPDTALLTTTGSPIGGAGATTLERRYATPVDENGYVYIIARSDTAPSFPLGRRRIYRFHTDTNNVQLFDSSTYGNMYIQGLTLRGSGAAKTLYVIGDSAVFRIPIGTQNFNTIAPTMVARVTPGRRMVFWDAEIGADNMLYVNFRADSAIGTLGNRPRGLLKFNLSTGTLPKTLADTVWTALIPDGDPVTTALDDGPTASGSDDILYMNTDVGVAPNNTFPSGIYAYTNLTASAPTRSLVWLDDDNNCSSFRSSLVTDHLGNIAYFENTTETVVLVSPPSGANSYTYTPAATIGVVTPGIAPLLVTIAQARVDADGNRRPDRLYDTLKVIGVVNSVNIQTTNFGYFIQDDNAGIQIFRSGLVGAPTLRPGYRVQVIGYIDYFRGTTEIIPLNLATDITILDTGNVVTSIPLTIGQYMADPERYESRRIQLTLAHPFNFTSAQWPPAGTSANLTIWNGLDTTIMRIDSDTEIDGSPYPAFPVRLTGTATQFTTATTNDTTGYQITPMFISDFVPFNAPPITNFRLLTPANGSVIVIDTTANYTFSWRRSIDFNGDPITYQVKPVAFAGITSGPDSFLTRTGAQLANTYLVGTDVIDFRWTVLAASTGNPAVSSRDTFSVVLRRSAPAAGWAAQTSGTTATLYSVKAVNQSVAWIGGAGGLVLRTTNSGANWTSVGGGRIGTADIYAIEATSATTAFVTTSPAATYIFRTTNGGTQWDTVFSQAGGFINAIRMFDANNGIAVGDPVGGKWTIAKTTNGGSTWARTATEPNQVGGEFGANNGLAYLAPNTLWMTPGGATNRIYKSTNQGTNWTSSTLPFNGFAAGVWFNNANVGLVGSSAGSLARSTDGGSTWTTVSPAPPGTGAIHGISGSGSHFFATRGQTVVSSANFGQTYTVSYSGGVGTLLEHLNMSFIGSTVRGWAVSSTGGIAAYYAALTGVDDAVELVPETFTLAQNYPNPFNPTTTIRYSLPKDAYVSLKVYNLLGQEIATLKEESQTIGTFNVVWNGRNNYGAQVATGMYIYRLEAKPNDGSQPFVMSKRMLLVK